MQSCCVLRAVLGAERRKMLGLLRKCPSTSSKRLQLDRRRREDDREYGDADDGPVAARRPRRGGVDYHKYGDANAAIYDAPPRVRRPRRGGVDYGSGTSAPMTRLSSQHLG